MMSSPAQAWDFQSEIELLQGVRSRYEALGFEFTVHPGPELLPKFLGSYVPDAIATKADQKIAIEVKGRQSPAVQRRLEEIRRLFDGQQDWQFQILFASRDINSELDIPVASSSAILKRLEEVRLLNEQGNARAALVMAWSLLEAALLSVEQEHGAKPRTPGTVVQKLVMEGYLPAEAEQSVRDLIRIRNQIVHGHVEVEPSREDVEKLVEAVEQALSVGSHGYS